MKKIITLILIAFTVTSCERDVKQRVYGCSKSQQSKVSEFIQSSIKNANNMSDEEMEDVIYQLEHTAVRCNCSQYEVNIHHEGDDMGEISDGVDSLIYYRY